MIMQSEWKHLSLDRFLVERSEKNFSGKNHTVYSVTNERGFVPQTEHFSRAIHSKETSNYKIFRKHDFGYNPARINIGSIALNEKYDIGLLSPMYVIFGTTSELLPTYLKYLVQTPEFRREVINNTAGSVRESLNFSSFSNFFFLFPNVVVQGKITTVLQKVDEVIEKTNALIKKYKRVRAGMVQDMFGYGLDGKGKLRSTRPTEWKIAKLKDVCDIRSGSTPARSASVYWHGQYPWVSAKDMKSFEIWDSQERITQKAISAGHNTVPKGTILVVTRGMILAHTFPVGIVMRPVSFNQDLKALICKESVGHRFLAHWMLAHTDMFLKLATSATHGTKKIDVVDIEECEIKLPPIHEQHAIAERLDSIDSLISSQEDIYQKLQTTKTALVRDLLTGRVMTDALIEK